MTGSKRFISLRWRMMSPVFLAVLLVAMGGAYLLGRNLTGGLNISQESILLQSSAAATERAANLYDYHRQEAQRAAFTIGVPEALRDRRTQDLEPILRSLIRANNLDSIILTDLSGVEVLGLQRNINPDQTTPQTQFALGTGTDLSAEAIVRAVLDEAFVGATGLLRTPQGLMLFTGVPVYLGDAPVGVALVGQTLDSVLADLRSSAVADLMLYGPNGDLLQTTYNADRQPLALSDEVFQQAILAVGQVPVQGLQIGQMSYQAAYQPFSFGPNTLGVLGALMPDDVPYITAMGRQLTALFAAGLAGVVVFVVYIGLNRVTARADQVAKVAGQLAIGHSVARTQMQPTDEIGAIGFTLDQYAEKTQQRQDALRRELRRKRRELNHMVTVLGALPEGVVLQDNEGRVLLINDRARELLGSQRVFRSAGLHELADLAKGQQGPSLIPGLYTLGDPHRVRLDGRMVSAQAAAVSSMSDHRLGTVILLRDITDEIRREQERAIMLQRINQEVEQPLVGLAKLGLGSSSDMVKSFARQIAKQAIGLHRMIVDMQELDYIDGLSIQRQQRPLRVETLIWSIANEWRQIAQASGLTMHIIIEQKGLYILGDEKRLRWAIGNVIDNALKYTPPDGALTLEIQGESDGRANLRVRDNGVGISREDRPYVFNRFYRGRPVTESGEPLYVPGMGQGLYIAKHIIESHGGSIHLKSSIERGTAVYMRLPLTASEGLELPQVDMDGETVRLSEDAIIKRNNVR